MAHIFKRGEIYWGKIERQGRRYRRSLKTASRKVAFTRLTKWIAELEGHGFGERAARSFDDAVLKFTAEYLPTLKPMSARRYNFSINSLTRSFEGVALAKIRSASLTEFVNTRRAEGAQPGTVRRDLACLSSIFGMTIEWEWEETNPVPGFMKRMKKRGLKEAAPRTRYLSHDEETALLAHAAPHVAGAIMFAIDTGLRREEQFGLKWPAIDQARSQIEIKGATSKNAKDRQVPLLPRALAMVGALPRHIGLPWVFWHVDKRGRAKRFGNLEKGLKAAARRAGIKDLRWHDLRRTCGCRLLQDRRMKMHEVQHWLGHSSVTVTEKAYAFLKVDQLHVAAGTKTATASATDG